MIAEHYIIIVLWILGGDMTVSSLKAIQFRQRKYDLLDEFVFLFMMLTWPAVVLWGILTRRFK